MIRVVTETDECRRLWERFSPHERAWDEWDLMNAFHDADRYRFRFMVHGGGNGEDGLLPLVEDTSDGSFELFGGCYPENRELWINTGDFPECYAQLPDNTAFFDLKGSWVETLLENFPEFAPNFAEQDSQYYLVPAQFDFDFVNHINGFSKDKRKGFHRDLRRIRERNLQLDWSEADETEAFFALSVKNFGDESDYAGEAGQREVRRVIGELRRLGWLRTLTILVDGVKQAVSMSLLYNNEWIALYAASNNDYDNLGKLLTVETIQEACRLRVDEINYMTGMAWKAAWRMREKPCRTFRKPARSPVQAADDSL